MTAAQDTSRLVAQLRRRERWLVALAAVRAELLSGGTTADAMSLIVERCALLTEADGAMILLPGGDGQLVVCAATGPLADFDAGPGTAAIGGDIDGEPDPWTAAIRAAAGVLRTADFPAPGNAGLARAWSASDSLLVAPIPMRNSGPDGLVICLRRAGRPAFEPESEPELVGLAEQASIAIEVAGRAEERRLAELVADRERIARELHDQVVQRLFAVGLSLQSQLRSIDDPTANRRVDEAIGEIDEAIADLRSSIFDLRAASDARTSLRRRLAGIVTGAQAADLRAVLRCRGPIDTMVPPELAVEVEAVVREAVSNAVRHSGGSRVAVTVTAGKSLDITVADNGRGIPHGVPRSGLKNLADRALRCGGEMHVDSVIRDGETDPCAVTGTTIRWTAPL